MASMKVEQHDPLLKSSDGKAKISPAASSMSSTALPLNFSSLARMVGDAKTSALGK